MEIKIGEEEKQLSEIEKKCLLNDLLEIEDWVFKAIEGKVNNCKKRLLKEWYPKLMADTNIETMPANEKDLLNLIFSHPDYKNRAKRDAEEII